ncbi:S8 family peptidase [Achromobacter aegrifaciens]|uniref:S8 family peptidase n=1 Tax=Achromobacter aegrifaciens TaxID=1287736 RepID=UPI0027B9B413|nr:S8 family peptidase [Achromobacter aegrifaciens]WLW61890.1 S8 family peptidase [Achromobacter aegrifaciens]
MANFLIGQGEALTEDITGPSRNMDKAEIYTLSQARERLHLQFENLSAELKQLPDNACPEGLAVAKVTLNPSYIARSYFPQAMFKDLGVASVGSRAVRLVPDAWKRKGPPRETSTTEIYVAGKRKTLMRLNEWAKNLIEESAEALDLAHIERVSPFRAVERIRGKIGTRHSNRKRTYEVGLHLIPGDTEQVVERAFQKFALNLNVELFSELTFNASNLWFVPVACTPEQAHELAEFTFVRVIRTMPMLRSVGREPRTGSAQLHCELPNDEPMSAEPRVAILDGGLPKSHPIGRWVRNYRLMDEHANGSPGGMEHGLAVSSSFLFGPLQSGTKAPVPYSYIDHLRVVDALHQDPLELYRSLRFIEEILLSGAYEFINLSLGPALPVDDDEVHAWTSVIDDLLSDGKTFMTVAAGNNGNEDTDHEARVQVPADCVNAIAVGAADSSLESWERAPYSAIGPGRSPGVIKPDLLAYGGGADEYFHVLTRGARPTLVPDFGTSLASPNLLRNAVGVRAVLGTTLTPLAIKALLVHAAEDNGYDKREVGWGKIPEDLMDIISCPDGVARIVYQGELKPGKYLRAALPIPKGGLSGRVELCATFCYASPTDPQDAASYTRAGLEVVFRPKLANVKPGMKTATSNSFFERKRFATEHELRADQGKWETVMHGRAKKLGSSLDEAVFDIHYNARTGGGTAKRAPKIPYALVLTVKAPRHPNVYSDILRSYSTQLVPIRPKLIVPVRTRNG